MTENKKSSKKDLIYFLYFIIALIVFVFSAFVYKESNKKVEAKPIHTPSVPREPSLDAPAIK